MEKLLLQYGIKVVTMLIVGGGHRRFAFTKKMASSKIFIEYRLEVPGCTEVDGEVHSAEIPHESKGNFGARLSVLIQQDRRNYEFLMFYNAIDLRIPILLAQTVVFLCDLCDKCADDHLVNILRGVCPDPLIPHEIKDKEDRDIANNLISLKIKMILQIIQENRSSEN